MGGGCCDSRDYGDPHRLMPVSDPDRKLSRRNQMLRDDDIFSKVEQKNKQTKTDGSFLSIHL